MSKKSCISKESTSRKQTFFPLQLMRCLHFEKKIQQFDQNRSKTAGDHRHILGPLALLKTDSFYKDGSVFSPENTIFIKL